MMCRVKAVILCAFAAAFGQVAPAVAEEGVIASGVLYGGTSQKVVVCYFTNHGGADVKVSNVSVFNANGTSVAPVIDTCGGSGSVVLTGGDSCERAANIAGNAVYGCRAKVGNLGPVRGTVEVRDQNQNVLNSLPMR